MNTYLINTLKKMPYILLKSVLEASSAGQIFNKTTDMIEQGHHHRECRF